MCQDEDFFFGYGIGVRWTSPHFRVFSGTEDVDLLAPPWGLPRGFRVETVGVLALVPAGGGAAVELPFKAGETQNVEARWLIAALTTARGITVYW